LRLVEHVCDRVAVMYLGRIVEHAPAAALYRRPLHPYTQALLASTPSLEPGRTTSSAVRGETPSATRPPAGCPFHPRCPVAVGECATKNPRLVEAEPEHRVACHLVGQ
ncbi:MAG TPA: oligopeptide/dipeptide ABC transporter ATP-binding protein, partial [Candidatus Polarisedimenticolaceae bacterium]|nr:oligopeptide/dipeptide ABC transporter ATP-binding protein [Candidatus Polarisedimenticolaceae bacterium]